MNATAALAVAQPTPAATAATAPTDEARRMLTTHALVLRSESRRARIRRTDQSYLVQRNCAYRFLRLSPDLGPDPGRCQRVNFFVVPANVDDSPIGNCQHLPAI